MSVFKQEDGHGHSLTLLNTDGLITCTFADPEGTAARLRNMTSFKCRPDDVFICAPGKSGTHWTWEIVGMLYKGRAETITKSKVVSMIEAAPWDSLEKQESPRILNTHLPYKMLPQQAKEMKCKIVHVLRNPKDVAVSLYKHESTMALYEYQGKWEQFLPLFLQGKTEYNSWFDYVLEWEEEMARNPNLPILLVYYEDLKEDSLREVSRIGKFLGIENKNGLFEAISEKCQFHNMEKDKKAYMAPEGIDFGENFTFYRKGVVGDWKNWFTDEQSEMFDRLYKEKMQNSNLKIRFTLEYGGK